MLSQEIPGRQYVLGTGVDAEVTVAGSYTGSDYHQWLAGVASGYGYRVREHGALTIIENPEHTQTAALGESMASVVFPGSQAITKVANEVLHGQGSAHYDETAGLVTATGPTDLIEEIVKLHEAWSEHTGGSGLVDVIALRYANSQDVIASLRDLDLPVALAAVTDTKLAVNGLRSDVDKIRSVVSKTDAAAESIRARIVIFESTVEAAVKYATALDVADSQVMGDIGSLGNPVAAAATASLFDEGSNFSLSALRRDNDVSVVSEPQLLLSPGARSSVLVGEQVPVPGDREITDDGREIQSINRENVGVSLDMTARRYGEEGFEAEIEVEVSEVREALNDELGVIIGERSMSSAFTADGCQPIFLGGLLSERSVDNGQGIPGLEGASRAILGGSTEESLERRYLGIAIEVSSAGRDCTSALARRAGAPEEVASRFGDERKPGPGCSVL